MLTIKKLSLIALAAFCTAGAQAQFGKKLLKAGNIEAGEKVLKAATLSDEDMAELSLESVEWMDANNPVAEPGDPYADRLNGLIKDLKIDPDLTLNFKVYVVSDVNAFATPDGSVRVMAGLMDLMNDDELLSVIGHEIGHVKLGHSKKRYRTAYGISAAKDVASANSGVGAVIAEGQMGGFVENVLNAQFSQKNESQSDEYGFQWMVDNNLNYRGMEGAFAKLAELSGDGGKGSLTSSHPGSAKRSARAKKWADKQDKQ